ncbi:unnamed protein product [Rotaria magnacalcarata]
MAPLYYILKCQEWNSSQKSAPKCHKRLNDVYCISNKRIRLIQRTIAKFILPDSSNDENTNDDNPMMKKIM